MPKCVGKIIIPAGRKPWPHELRVAEILASAGHQVEFLPEAITKTADILLDGVEFEIKSPITSSINSLEHILKRGLRQSKNLIFDASRMRDGSGAVKLKRFLASQIKNKTQAKRLIIISKRGQIVDML